MIIPLAQELQNHGFDPKVAMPIIEVYKRFQKRIYDSMSTHHIVPTALGGSEEEHNKKVMVHRRHAGLHDYFGNEPTAQKVRVVLEDDQTALQPGFITAMDALLEKCERRHWIYAKGIWRR